MAETELYRLEGRVEEGEGEGGEEEWGRRWSMGWEKMGEERDG